MSECRSCGMEVDPAEATCSNCGAPVEGSTQSFAAVISETAQVESAASSEPLLVVQKGPEVGERFVIDSPVLSVGRDPASDIFLNDVTVSRHHAEFRRIGEQVSVVDVGSLNGTYVNGMRVDEAHLTHGDALQVGRFQLVFLAGNAP